MQSPFDTLHYEFDFVVAGLDVPADRPCGAELFLATTAGEPIWSYTRLREDAPSYNDSGAFKPIADGRATMHGIFEVAHAVRALAGSLEVRCEGDVDYEVGQLRFSLPAPSMDQTTTVPGTFRFHSAWNPNREQRRISEQATFYLSTTPTERRPVQVDATNCPDGGGENHFDIRYTTHFGTDVIDNRWDIDFTLDSDALKHEIRDEHFALTRVSWSAVLRYCPGENASGVQVELEVRDPERTFGKRRFYINERASRGETLSTAVLPTTYEEQRAFEVQRRNELERVSGVIEVQ